MSEPSDLQKCDGQEKADAAPEPAVPALSKEAKPRASLKDQLSIMISSVSLMVSLTVAFLSWMPRNEVKVRLAGWEIENRLDANHQDKVVTWLAFVNSGNRTALVTGAEWEVRFAGDKNLDNGAFAAPCSTDRGEFPFALEKDKVKFVRFRSPLSGVMNFAGEDAETLQSNPKPPERKAVWMDYAIKLAAIDGKGDEHGARIPCGAVEVKAGKWSSFNPTSVKVPLFGQRGVDVSFRINTEEPEESPSKPAQPSEAGAGKD